MLYVCCTLVEICYMTQPLKTISVIYVFLRFVVHHLVAWTHGAAQLIRLDRTDNGGIEKVPKTRYWLALKFWRRNNDDVISGTLFLEGWRVFWISCVRPTSV